MGAGPENTIPEEIGLSKAMEDDIQQTRQRVEYFTNQVRLNLLPYSIKDRAQPSFYLLYLFIVWSVKLMLARNMLILQLSFRNVLVLLDCHSPHVCEHILQFHRTSNILTIVYPFFG